MRNCCTVGRFLRAIEPVRGDFLRLVVAESDVGGELRRYLAASTTIEGGCATSAALFARLPLSLGWGFGGAGQQLWIVSGLVSDDVARLTLFLGTGERRPVPPRDDVVIVRVQRVKFPARVVGYDRAGRVVGVVTITG